MKCYKKNGTRVVEISDLTFISDRRHKLGWLGLHIRHFSIKFALSRADNVIVPSADVAKDVVRYYFFPKDSIYITGSAEPYSATSHKS